MVSLAKKVTVLILAFTIVMNFTACANSSNEQDTKVEIQEDATLSLWYTDDTITAYLQQVANEYHESNQQVTIVPTLVESDEYLENMYNSSVKENNSSDLYILSSDDLEKAYLMGLVVSNDTYKSTYTEAVYGKAGIEASKFNEKLLGYPLFFDTTVMVYNKKYATPMNTFTELTTFSNNFQDTEDDIQIEYIVKWDVSDITTNYAFVGPHMNIGGATSDDNSNIQINANSVKSSLSEFIKFKSDYGFVRETTTASECIGLFTSNKLLFTLAKTSDLKTINESGVEYGICKIPDLTSSLKTKTISTTQMMAVNPYSKNIKVAKSVAKAITYDYANEFYGLSGYASARADLDNNPTPEYSNLYNIYSDSIVKAQFMNIGDFYLQLEIMLHQAWDGTSIDESYDTFINYVNTQLITKTATK